MSQQPNDPVNPSHYNGTNCLNAIAIATTNLSGNEAFCTGNAIKYLWRWKAKNGVQDLLKARQYIDYLIESQRK